MLKLNYNSKVATSRNLGKKDLVNGYIPLKLVEVEGALLSNCYLDLT
jgi:hypothetical protein